jgi:hypothetical protein
MLFWISQVSVCKVVAHGIRTGCHWVQEAGYFKQQTALGFMKNVMPAIFATI